MSTRRPTIHLILPRSDAVGLHHVLSHRFVPLNLMTLAALAEREGWDATIIDENHQSLPDDVPDLVGITVWTMFAPRAYRIADAYRARGVPVVLGGVHASLLPGEALRHADAVCVGEAEGAMTTILADAAAGSLAGIYRGSWDGMAEAPSLGEMARYYDDFPGFRYWPQYSIQSTRGCRFNCDYCSVIRINGRGQRHRDPSQVVEQLRARTMSNRLTSGLFFTDDDFGSDLEYTEELLTAMVDAKMRVKWAAQTSIGIARNEQLLDLARRAGCSLFFLGLESASRASLVETNKKNRPQEYKEFISRIHGAGIAVEGAFMFGFDHDELTVFDETVDFADDIGVDLAFFTALTPLPGTKTFAHYWDDGRIVDFDWANYTSQRAVFEPIGMTRAQLDAGVRHAYLSFYSRRRRLHRFRRQWGQLPKDWTIILAAVGASFPREFKKLGREDANLTPYTPAPEDLEQLAVTSRADANAAIWLAADQADGGSPDAVTGHTVDTGVPVRLGR